MSGHSTHIRQDVSLIGPKSQPPCAAHCEHIVPTFAGFAVTDNRWISQRDAKNLCPQINTWCRSIAWITIRW